MFEQGGDPKEIVKEKGLAQTSDDSFIKNIVEEVIIKPCRNGGLQNGKEAALQFLVGRGMKLSGGKANPERVAKITERKTGGIK